MVHELVQQYRRPLPGPPVPDVPLQIYSHRWHPRRGYGTGACYLCFSVLNAQSRQSSFGFGQVGGTALVIHPRYLLGSLEPSVYESYKVSNRARALQSYKAMSEMMITNSLVKIKEAPPYSLDMERRVLLNSMARASLDPKTGSYSFSKKLSTIIQTDTTHIKAAKEISRVLSETGSATGVGIDHGRYFIA
jgi:hypothetical protein